MGSPPLVWARAEVLVWNAICLPSAGLYCSVWYSNKHLSKVHVSSHTALGNWKKKKTQLIPCTKIEGKRGECGFLFQPSVRVLNIDFYGRLNGLVLLSTKMSRNNRLFKVLCSTKCLHNKLLQIPFFFLLTNIRSHSWPDCVCSHGIVVPRSLADVLRWRNSLCTKSIHVPLQLLLHPAVFHISPSFLLSFFLTHIEMKGLLHDDGCCLAAIQATHLPDCCSSFSSTTPPNSIGSVVSPFQGLSQGLQMCFLEQQWWTLAEISSVSD